MFCPACANPNSVEQKFCRSCGMNLESSATSLLEQYPDGSRSDLQRKERSLERFGKVAFTGLGVVVSIGVLGVIYAILENMVLSGRRPYAGVLLIAFVVFAALGLAYVMWAESLKDQRQKLNNPRELPSPEPNLQLPPRDTKHLIPAPSVIEGTTELLDIKRKPKS